MIAYGCEEKNKIPSPEDRICPQCGREVEVFVLKGRVYEDAVCQCGYVIKEEKQIVMVADQEEK